jgi:hypothetical protein
MDLEDGDIGSCIINFCVSENLLWKKNVSELEGSWHVFEAPVEVLFSFFFSSELIVFYAD